MPELFRAFHSPLIVDRFDPNAQVSLYLGDCRDMLKTVPDESTMLVITSPPYNLGKPYEIRRLKLEDYLNQQREVIKECVRILNKRGSICWEVGNYVEKGEITPLDTVLYPFFKEHGLKLRNRIVWHFGHGLHCSKRFSGRYETINWYTKTDDYIFNLDVVRVPQKYPQKKYYKGPKRGLFSCNPLGGNPTDVWHIPNVKFNHVEKTIHPCQFPVELVERLVLALTNKDDLVVDPFIGVGSTAVAALIHNRRAAGSDIVPEYIKIARDRIIKAAEGRLRIRPMGRPIYEPKQVALEKPKELRLDHYHT